MLRKLLLLGSLDKKKEATSFPFCPMDDRRRNKLHYTEINRNSRVGVNLGGVGVEYIIERQ